MARISRDQDAVPYRSNALNVSTFEIKSRNVLSPTIRCMVHVKGPTDINEGLIQGVMFFWERM